MGDELVEAGSGAADFNVELKVKMLSWLFCPMLWDLFDSIRVTNYTNSALDGLELSIISEPKFFEDVTISLGSLASGDFKSIRDFSFIEYDARAAIELDERQDSLLSIAVKREGIELAKNEIAIERVPLKVWLKGDEIGTLSRLCNKNETLAKRLGQKALIAGGNDLDRFKCVYEALRAFGLTRSQEMAYLSTRDARQEGEFVRFGSEVLINEECTLSEASVILASALLNLSLSPMIIGANNTMYLGLCDGMGEAVLDVLPSQLIENEKDERAVFIDVSALFENLDFEKAQARADEFFELPSKKRDGLVKYCVDILSLQRQGLRALPVKEGLSGETVFDEARLFSQTQSLDDEDSLEDLTSKVEPLSKYARWQRDILDLSPQNPLISFKTGKANVEIAPLSLEEVEDAVSSEARLVLAPLNMLGKNQGTSLNQATLGKLLKELKTQNHLTTLHEENDLNARLTALFRTSKKTIEETGANALYLAVGFIKWLDTTCSMARSRKNGAVERLSPILLLPVELSRRSVKGGFSIKSRGEEAQVNLSLMQNFKLNYDLDLSGFTLLPRGEHGLDVTKVIDFVKKAIACKKGWSVEEKISLGLFRFSRFAMFSELKERENDIKAHPIVKSIIDARLDKSLACDEDGEVEDLDEESDLMQAENMPPKGTLYLPLDADGSQVKAIKDALSGKSFVMHGPPGTGKSQTISNIIANCLAYGKRVLFVSEKAAALDVVYSRLQALGLADFCFELHSNKTAKKAALAQLERSAEILNSAVDVNYYDAAQRESEAVDSLDGFVSLMHNTLSSGFSIYEALEEFYRASEAIKDTPVNVQIDPKLLHRQTLEKGEAALKRLLNSASVFGEPKYSPFYYALNVKTDARFKKQLIEACGEVTRLYVPFNNALNNFLKLCEDKNGRTFDDLSLYGLKKLVKILDNVVKFERSNGFIRLFIKGKNSKLFKQLVGFCKDNSSSFISDLNKIKEFLVAEEALRSIVGLKNIKAAIKSGNGLFKVRDYARTLSRAARQMSGGVSLIKEHLELKRAFDRAVSLKACSTIARQYYDGVISSDALINCFKKSFFATYVEHEIEKEAVLREFLYSKQEHAVTEFAALKELTRQLSAKEIYRLAALRVPSFSRASVASSDPSILLKAIKNGCRDMPLRQLFEKIPKLLVTLKPIIFMSPLSAAEFLPTSFPQFDLVIYDEASQLVTSEAIGSISRGKSVIIAGDPKQLPPTTFFKSQNLEKDNDFSLDLESLLDDVMVLNLPSHSLRWHYRSTHESLIAFSNACYYDNSLITFPSFDDRCSKVTLVEVNGQYDRGGTRTNRQEAEAIVNELFKRVRNGASSIGVIAFNVSQAELIEDLIDTRLKEDASLEEAFNNMREPLFVKNLENVQGDERDVILFSICFGEDSNGKMPLNFGPINKEGGHRRLNVAITRSRCEMRVFNSIPFDRMRVNKATVRGVRDLFAFLRYAHEGVIFEPSSNEALSDEKQDNKSELVLAVARGLNELGLEVETNVGRSINKVDIAVKGKDEESDKFSLGVILDTDTHAKIEFARDREILKEAMLNRLGWRTLRSYAVEFWEEPLKMLSRIKQAALDTSFKSNQNTEETLQLKVLDALSDAKKVQGNKEKSAEPYETVQLKEQRPNRLFDASYMHVLISQIKQIIAGEAPIALEALVRKINANWGFDKLTDVNRKFIESALKNVNHYKNETLDTQFVWLSRMQCNSYDIWRSNLDKSRSLDKICKEEYAVAMHAILQSCLSASPADLMRATAQEFSLNRSPSLIQRLETALDLLLEKEKAYLGEDGRVYLK